MRQPSNNNRNTNYSRPLAETINYEEDKVSPEKDDEKPIYESSEGPIQKTRTTFPGRSVVSGTKQPPKNVVSSFDSFGMSGNLVKRSLGGLASGGYKRGAIQDDFLEQHDEDDESSLRQSAESGEIRAAFPRKWIMMFKNW